MYLLASCASGSADDVMQLLMKHQSKKKENRCPLCHSLAQYGVLREEYGAQSAHSARP